MSLGKYIKTAFLNRWNLLLLAGGAGFALLSGWPDVVGALVLAAELGYLGLLGTHPRFQKYVDAQEAKAAREASGVDTQQALRTVMRSLPKDLLKKFEALRSRCLQLRQIALDLKQPGRAGEPLPLDSIQLAGLDRLLWIYLKLLFTSHSLQRFFEATREDEINEEIERLEKQVERARSDSDSHQREKLLHTLEDNLQTCRARLENYRKAADNYQLVQLEINRLENKIQSLSELAVNRHEPDFISGQVDQVAASMLDTERTINDLQFVTGLQKSDDEVPELMRPTEVHFN